MSDMSIVLCAFIFGVFSLCVFIVACVYQREITDFIKEIKG